MNSRVKKPKSLEIFSQEDFVEYCNSKVDYNKIGKFIDFGGQYKVFEYGSNKVIKIPMSKEEVYYRIDNWGHKTYSYEAKYNSLKLNRKRSFQFFKKNKDIPKDILGNVEFINESIIQDKIINWELFFPNSTITQKKAYINQILEIYRIFWSYGVHETIHNFSLNCGLDSRDRIVLFDFGEITRNKAVVFMDLLSNYRFNSWSANQLKAEIKEYYIRESKSRLNIKNLNSIWKSNIK